MTTQELISLALENGFSRAYVFEPERAERAFIHRMNERVADEPKEIFEDTKRVIVLLYPYEPFENDAKKPSVSAYYFASNSAYHAAKTVAAQIEKEGYTAFSNAQIAIKPLLVKTGIGEAGKNSLISVDGLGTRFHVQIILTDMPLETTKRGEKKPFSALCADCGACVRACPGGAISDDGKIDIDRCIRGADGGEIAPEWMRKKFENRLLGCDVCQDVCPRNASIPYRKMNESEEEAMDLSLLLDGNLRALVDKIGRNYARKERIRLKAILAAANLNRRDLIEKIEEISINGTDKEKEHARWALERLLKEEDK